jgi:hypothetical protein
MQIFISKRSDPEPNQQTHLYFPNVREIGFLNLKNYVIFNIIFCYGALRPLFGSASFIWIRYKKKLYHQICRLYLIH